MSKLDPSVQMPIIAMTTSGLNITVKKDRDELEALLTFLLRTNKESDFVGFLIDRIID